MPDFLKRKLEAEYPNNPGAVWGTMNKLGAVKGNRETKKGAAMERKHESDMKKDPPKVKPHVGFRSVVKATSRDAHTLSSGERKSLPKSKFGLPGARKYPMPDKAHAVLAKGRATQMEHEGKLSSSSAAHIKAKANRMLGESKSVKNPFSGKMKKRA